MYDNREVFLPMESQETAWRPSLAMYMNPYSLHTETQLQRKKCAIIGFK